MVAQSVIKIYPAMPGETLLAVEKRVKTESLSQERTTLAEIAACIKRRVNVLKKYLSSPSEYGKQLFTRRN